MTELEKLESFITRLGWFSNSIKLTITLESKFEGFYGKASENWEQQVSIIIESPDEKICPNISITGKRYQSIDSVAKSVMREIEKWKNT